MAHPPHDPYTGPPRWVKVSGIIALVLILLLVLLMVLSGGRHGPGRHLRTGDPGHGPPPPADRR